jgi:hypothetical protein
VSSGINDTIETRLTPNQVTQEILQHTVGPFGIAKSKDKPFRLVKTGPPLILNLRVPMSWEYQADVTLTVKHETDRTQICVTIDDNFLSKSLLVLMPVILTIALFFWNPTPSIAMKLGGVLFIWIFSLIAFMYHLRHERIYKERVLKFLNDIIGNNSD